MSLPKFPDTNDDLNFEVSISQILSSIAMEELGLSHIINAEGEKLQFILGTLHEGKPSKDPTIDDLLEINDSVKDLLSTVSINQMLLYAKMSSALNTYSKKDKRDYKNFSAQKKIAPQATE